MSDDVKLQHSTPANNTSISRSGTPTNWAEFHALSREVQAGLEQMRTAARGIEQALDRIVRVLRS